MSTTYKVVFTGNLKENVTEDQALQGLVSSFGLNKKQADTLLKAKRPVVVKKGITMDQGKALALRLANLGFKVKLLKEEAATAKKTPVPPPKPAAKTATKPAEKTVATAKKPAGKTAPPPPPSPESENKVKPVVAEQEPKGLLGKIPIDHYRDVLTNALDTAKEYPQAWIAAIKDRKKSSTAPKETDNTEQEKEGILSKIDIDHYRDMLTSALDTAKEYPQTWIAAIKERKESSATPKETDNTEQEKEGILSRIDVDHYRDMLTNALDTAKEYPQTWIDALKDRRKSSAAPDPQDTEAKTGKTALPSLGLPMLWERIKTALSGLREGRDTENDSDNSFIARMKGYPKAWIAAIKPGKAVPETPPALPTAPSVPPAENERSGTASPEDRFFTPPEEAATAYQEKMQHSVPQQVAALHGYRWLVYAFQLFIEYPFPWIGMSLTMYILFGLLSLIPVAGPFICALLIPLFLGVLMLCAHKQESGNELCFQHFFTSFPNNILQFLLLGILAAVGMIVCALPVLAPTLMGLFFANGVDAEAAAAGSQMMLLGRALLSMALAIVFTMSMWFAPTLVAVKSHSALSAIKMSLHAARKNIGALLVFGISIMAICIALIFAADIIIPLLVADGFQVSNLFLGLPLLILTLLALPSTAVVALSMYTSYRDIFYR